MTPYYEHHGIVIYHGDCRDILPSLPKVDLVLTDPPYGIDYSPEGGGKVPKRFTNADKVIGDDAPFDASWLLLLAKDATIWGASNFSHTLPPSRGWLVWDKKCGVNLTNQFSDCEIAWTSRNAPIRIFRHRWTGYMKDSEQYEQRQHPTQKPIDLMAWCLSLFPNAQTILDPFMGSGTTLRAAKDLGRQAIGIEIEEKYCEIAAKRLSQEVLPL
jgi:site-specific DNA-methyltransferase (adenine-specific)